MKQLLAISVACLAALGVLALARPAEAANCGCYLDPDCPKDHYCNWKANCTRHCEIQGTWAPGWGQPPVSKADCDSYTGPCHDDLPDPANGDDGDEQNCEPPTAAIPGGGSMTFKVRDGDCAKGKRPVEVEQGRQQIQRSTQVLVDFALAGGGFVVLRETPYFNDVMHNVADLALGQYDYVFPLVATDPSFMTDLRGTCAAEALQKLGEGLLAEMDRAVANPELSQSANGAPLSIFGRKLDEPFQTAEATGEAAYAILTTLPADCQEWVQSRAHNCQFPHPEEHHHSFDYENGLDCISQQLAAMARSMDLIP